MDLGGDSYRSNYIKVLMDNNIQCTGDWCKEYGTNNGFDCKDMGVECYQVEHIIDKQNTPYDKCNMNILGNVIMASGTWNNQIGNRCWDDIKREKIAVYGKDIFCKAIKNVIDCTKCDASLPIECIPIKDEPVGKITWIIIGVILAFIIICALVFLGIKYKEVIRQKFQNAFGHNFNRVPTTV